MKTFSNFLSVASYSRVFVCALLSSLRDRLVILICENKKQEIGRYVLASMPVPVLVPVVWSELLDSYTAM
jgi:hypothetical protein